MTNTRKKRARAIQAKTGKSYAAAINQLNATLNKTTEQDWDQATRELDAEVQALYGTPERDPDTLGPIDPVDLIPDYYKELSYDILYSRFQKPLGDPKPDMPGPDHVVPFSKVDLGKHAETYAEQLEENKRLGRLGPQPRDIRPTIPRATYRGFNWIAIDQLSYLEHLSILGQRETVSYQSGLHQLQNQDAVWWHDDSKPQQTYVMEELAYRGTPLHIASLIHQNYETASPSRVPLVCTSRELVEGETAYLLYTVPLNYWQANLKERAEVPPEWLTKLACYRKSPEYVPAYWGPWGERGRPTRESPGFDRE